LGKILLNAEQLGIELFSHLEIPESTDFYLALSGGKDSCVLLDLMSQVAKLQSLNLTLLHFDHGLQEQSASWEKHCKGLAKHYDLTFFSQRQLVHIDTKKGLEASARKARYAWFAEVITNQQTCKKRNQNSAVLLTAHHANDQAETLLINLMRGTGVNGLRGIARKKNQGNYTLIRPLLGFDQQQVSEYAEKNDLQWIDDPSNQEQKFRRNALRENVLPALSSIKHDAVQQFVKSADHMVTAERLLTDLALIDLQKVQQYPYCPLDQSYGINLQDIQKLGDTLSIERQSNALRYWLQQCGYPLNSQPQFQQLLGWANNGAGEKSELRNGDSVYRAYQQNLFVMPFVSSELSEQIPTKLVWDDLKQPLKVVMTDDKYKIHCCNTDKAQQFKGVEVIFRDEAKKQFSLKKRFQSEAIPHWRRHVAPIIIHNDKIIGIAGSIKDCLFRLK